MATPLRSHWRPFARLSTSRQSRLVGHTKRDFENLVRYAMYGLLKMLKSGNSRTYSRYIDGCYAPLARAVSLRLYSRT